MEALTQWLMNLVHHLGYLGIFIATMIESTFVPIPAEVTMIPAGMLAAEGKMNYWVVLLMSTLGVLAGSVLNYWLGATFGRAVVLRYGKYVWIRQRHIEKTEYFFARYGALAAFSGRLLPGIRHYIAFIAGIARMNRWKFMVYTTLGGLIWMWILLQLGYMAQMNADKNGHSAVSGLEIVLIVCVLLSGVAYFAQRWMMRHRRSADPTTNLTKGEQ